MITFITGLPGAGKTLNTIKMVHDEWGASNRPIYYRGIRDLKLPWTEIDEKEAQDWFNYPEGSIFVIDECQQVWPNRPHNRPVPESVKRMDTHRHKGYDFYVITQKPTMVDFGVRGFAGRHFHYERGYNREGTRKLEWQRAVDDPQDYHARQEAQVHRVKFDKSYYELYKSAEVHTHKPRIPKQFWYLIMAIMATGAAGVYSYKSIMSRTETEQYSYEYEQSIPGSDFISIGDPKPRRITSDNYLEQWEPRLQNIPHSAPIYDSLKEVKSFPRPQCIYHHRTGRCECYTQQATPLTIDKDVCIAIVKNGYFDPYKPDGYNQTEESPGGAGMANAPAPGISGIPEIPIEAGNNVFTGT